MTATEVTTIEHLDFDETIPCESIKTKCDAPATWIGRFTCPRCGSHCFGTQLGCDFHYERRETARPGICLDCLHVAPVARFWSFERLS